MWNCKSIVSISIYTSAVFHVRLLLVSVGTNCRPPSECRERVILETDSASRNLLSELLNRTDRRICIILRPEGAGPTPNPPRRLAATRARDSAIDSE